MVSIYRQHLSLYGSLRWCHTRRFATFTLIDDVDGNENGQLVDGPPKNVHAHDAALYMSLPSLKDHHVKILILRFDDDVNTWLILFVNLDTVL